MNAGNNHFGKLDACFHHLRVAGRARVKTCNLLTSLFRRDGTVIPCGKFVVEDYPHGLFVSFRCFLARRILAFEKMDGGS